MSAGTDGGRKPCGRGSILHTQSTRGLESQIIALDRSPAVGIGGRTVIDTSFSMDIGETVVVGTSRLRGGDKALIALLTAVPRGTARHE